MNLVTSIEMNNLKMFYYINDGIYGSFSSFLYEKTIYKFSCLKKYDLLHIGSYSDACATNFNGFETTKYFYIWKDS